MGTISNEMVSDMNTRIKLLNSRARQNQLSTHNWFWTETHVYNCRILASKKNGTRSLSTASSHSHSRKLTTTLDNGTHGRGHSRSRKLTDAVTTTTFSLTKQHDAVASTLTFSHSHIKVVTTTSKTRILVSDNRDAVTLK